MGRVVCRVWDNGALQRCDETTSRDRDSLSAVDLPCPPSPLFRISHDSTSQKEAFP